MKPYYQDDFVTLYHGDCIELADLWTCADVLVTDPPYGVSWKRGATTWYGKNGAAVKQKIETIAGDKTPEVRDLALASWGDNPGVVFGSWRVARPDNVQHRLIWHKIGRNPGPANAPWFSADEEIYIIGKGFGGKPHQTVYPTTENRAIEPGRVGHPTPKPVPLMERLVEKCPPGVIADPFAGSGSTLVAAKNLGRKVIGIELEEKYCEIIAKRCSQEVLDLGAFA